MSYAKMDLHPAARQGRAGFGSNMQTEAAPDFICIPGSVIYNRVYTKTALAETAGLFY